MIEYVTSAHLNSFGKQNDVTHLLKKSIDEPLESI